MQNEVAWAACNWGEEYEEYGCRALVFGLSGGWIWEMRLEML